MIQIVIVLTLIYLLIYGIALVQIHLADKKRKRMEAEKRIDDEEEHKDEDDHSR